ncbi:MAG: cyclic nucleotide-binding domain-containing protein [Myxococcota bacterium]
MLSRLGVERAERPLFAWSAACLGLLGAAAFALLNTAETLFLKRIGVEYLPLVLLASSALLVATTALIGRRLATADLLRGLPRLFLLLAALVAAFYPLMLWEMPGGPAVLVLAARQVLALGLLSFWIALGGLVTARQAKRLFGPLSAGLTLGSMAGSFASAPAARVLGLEAMPLVCALLLVGSAAAARGLRSAQPRRLEHGLGGAVASRSAASRGSAISVRELWRESRLFRLLLLSFFLGGLLGPVLYFQFSYVADAATTGPNGEQRLLALYAQFRGWLNVATLGAQLWLASRLYRHLGLPLSLALWPLLYLLGFGWLGVELALVAGIASLGTARVYEDGVAGAALRVLFNLFPDRLRSRAAGVLEGPVNRLGGVVGNALVIGALALGGVRWIGAASVPVAALWLTAALALRRVYPSLLLQASADGTLAATDAEKAQLLDSATVRALGRHLEDPDPAQCRAAIDLLSDADPKLAVGPLAEALEKAAPPTRPLLVEALHHLVEPLPPGQLRSASASEALARLIAERDALEADQRADLLQVYARLTGDDNPDREEQANSLRVLRRAMGDRAAAVRLAAIAELHRRGRPPPGVADLDSVLAGAIGGRDLLMRRTARKELRAILLSSTPDPTWNRRLSLLASRFEQRADRAETGEALVAVARRHGPAAAACAEQALGFADDRDARVRAAVLAFVGHVQLPEQAPRLARCLTSRDAAEAAAAREGLVALGAAALDALLAEHERGAPAQREAVASVLAELEIDADALVGLYRRQLEAARHALVLRAGLAGSQAPSLVLKRLEERVVEGLGALLTLASVLHDDERIAELERRLRRTADPRRRDVLVEALEALLSATERRELEPLFEAGPWQERGARAADQLGRSVPSSQGARAELLRDGDELTRDLAGAFAELEGDAAIGDAPGVRPMDLAVRLQSVTAFDRLSTRQLVRLAEAMREERHDAGQTIYGEGDEGSSLYVVLDGEVELSAGDLTLERVGAGAFFGEQAALDGVPRPVSARAVADVHLLRLDREELLEQMEEAPALGIGLAQHLSLRVRELQKRVRTSP